ncbi:unnamed protein product [Ostreobium quekettii]|uniref:Ubiquitin thioesterase OTU n=1 Tax=Ostreobium quekettii TaxID=121088 RepID=A0A8S1JAF4_9CHLO|nr:unnamed protein product [Ostreobium quekettii]
MTITLRCRGPTGQTVKFDGLDPSMSVAAFQDLLAKDTGVEPDAQEVLVGFPPKLVQLPADPWNTAISTLGIEHGETIVVRKNEFLRAVDSSVHRSAMVEQADTTDDEELARALALSMEDSAAVPGPSLAAEHDDVVRGAGSSKQVSSVALADGTHIVRRVVDADNSCLFTSVAYVVEQNRLKGYDLRQIIAAAVAEDPTTYNEGVLGKTTSEYQKWILNPERWGGQIELAILSAYYRTQIAAFDIRTMRCDVYGQEEGYQDLVMVVYDGLHYDALAVAHSEHADEELDITKFNPTTPTGNMIMQGAKTLVSKLNAASQFTDTAHFKLRCGQCFTGLRGEKDAVEHAKATGHKNFSEYK